MKQLPDRRALFLIAATSLAAVALALASDNKMGPRKARIQLTFRPPLVLYSPSISTFRHFIPQLVRIQSCVPLIRWVFSTV